MITIDFDIFYTHVLASLHFNENVKRETHQSKDGRDYIKVTYPKFKVGEEVVREVAVPPTYSKNTKSSFGTSMVTHFHATPQYNQIHLLFQDMSMKCGISYLACLRQP